jgi:hypothetical protein
MSTTIKYTFSIGESFKSLAYLFCMGHSTVAEIIPATCSAIYSVLKDDYLKASSLSCVK